MAPEVMPWTEPTDWKSRRTTGTWGVLVLTLVVELGLQWLAQIVAGGITGALVGINGLANITATDYEQINVTVLWSAIIITVIVVFMTATRTHSDLTWIKNPPNGTRWGIKWWPSFWRPVLIGAAVHGVIFGVVLAIYANAAHF
ncbi:hypothetical protein Q9R08_04895 [Microbacterium sp. QXD-8]|uniref:ABC transporter permease n=1 Tax=Microbacterium psychrotolerans TaxID=3068321 RepID=A0ABU0YY98_9MICO|nr:hypothetical protein [Microbacterium sp. QXD-8]MDQ7877309.1 hypothetical protein [Microbacterium sp. QXD-8]